MNASANNDTNKDKATASRDRASKIRNSNSAGTDQVEPSVSLDQLHYLLNYFEPRGFGLVLQVICFGRNAVLIPHKLGRIPVAMVAHAHRVFYELTKDPYFGLKLGNQGGLSRFQLMINLFQGMDKNSPRVEAEEMSLFSDAFDLKISYQDRRAEMLILADKDQSVSDFQFDHVMMNLKKAFAFFSPSYEPLWFLPRELTAEQKAMYESYLGPNIETGSNEYKVVLTEEFFQPGNNLAPEMVEQTKLTMKKGVKAQQDQQKFLDLLWSGIEKSFSDGLPKLAQVSECCGLTTRQIQYQLSGYGIQFQLLLDGFLMEDFVNALRENPALTPQELAERLKFSEVRSFKRSVKRWFGKPYSEVVAAIIKPY